MYFSDLCLRSIISKVGAICSAEVLDGEKKDGKTSNNERIGQRPVTSWHLMLKNFLAQRMLKTFAHLF
jgi:hypothetical protein